MAQAGNSPVGPFEIGSTASDRELSGSNKVNFDLAGAQNEVVLDIRVSASTDDAEERSSGVVVLASSDLELIQDVAAQTVGIRFNGVDVPQGSTITNAHIQFQVDEAKTGDTFLAIQGEDVDHAVTFSSNSHDITSRSRTLATVSWNPVPWLTIGEAGLDQQTTSIASVIQEIVDRPGWASGNSLAIIITGTGVRTAESYEGGQAGAPLLHVEYLPYGPVVSITSPANGSTFTEGNLVSFTGTASDIEDGDLSAGLNWTSDLDGALGTGGSFDRSNLSVGTHTITATAVDSSGLSDSDSINLTIISSANVLVGAGDMAGCGSERDSETASLLGNIAGTVVTLGDHVYPDGTESEFNDCYNPTWGLHKGRTRPAPGNHDYHTIGASGYFNYFGAAAGNPSEGYYSYNVGSWHIIVLNSQCAEVGGCFASSPQGQWLQADLASNPSLCTLAYWHHPLFSSDSVHGNNSNMLNFWWALYQAGADVILNGHAHTYERFAPQDPIGVANPQYGIRQFVVGTGGKDLYPFSAIQPNSEVRSNDTYGVLKMTLNTGSYDWEFIPIAGQTFTDMGSASCVTQPAPNNAPIAVDDSANTPEDMPVTVNVVANDSDPDGNLDTNSTNTACGTCSGPMNGTLVNRGNGAIEYTPNLNFNGLDGFTYQICDRGGLCAMATVTITVNPVSDPPVAMDDDAGTPQGRAVNINVAANDSDPDGNLAPGSANTTCTNCTTPANGSLVNNGNGTFTYTPTSDFTGSDSFVYEICDDTSVCETATVSIIVSSVTHANFHLSLASNGTVGGLTARDEDILEFNGASFAMSFDGSDVGVGGLDLDAFYVVDADTLLMSFNNAATIGSLSTVADSDIVRFDAISLGPETTGSFSMYFDGSDVGLDTSGEDVDAIELLTDGRLLISTLGNISVPGVTGVDEDLLAFTPASLGDVTSGAWAMYFDGSDVGLSTSSDEDIDGVSMVSNGDIYLTTLGNFAVAGVSGADEDVFVCTPGSLGMTTTCTFSSTLFFDGSLWELDANDLDAIDLPAGG